METKEFIYNQVDQLKLVNEANLIVIEELGEENRRLRECVEFYANEETEVVSSIEFNCLRMREPEFFGHTARKTLKELKGAKWITPLY